MKHLCLVCRKQFESRNINKRFCSDFCWEKYRRQKEKKVQIKVLEEIKLGIRKEKSYAELLEKATLTDPAYFMYRGILKDPSSIYGLYNIKLEQ